MRRRQSKFRTQILSGYVLVKMDMVDEAVASGEGHAQGHGFWELAGGLSP